MTEDNYVNILRESTQKNTYWLTGLNWVPKEKKTIKSFLSQLLAPKRNSVKEYNVSVSIENKDIKSNHMKFYGSGLLPKSHQRYKLYSLALAFCTKTINGYGIYCVDDTTYIFLASINGLPAVTSDNIGDITSINNALSLFLTLNDAPESGWDVLSQSDFPSDWHVLIENITNRQRRICRIRTNGLNRRIILQSSLLLLLSSTGIWWLSNPEPTEPVLTPEEIQARTKAMFAKPKPVPALPHPWASQIQADKLLQWCTKVQPPAPSALEGWLLKSGTCDQAGVTLQYNIQSGGTAEGFHKRSLEYFGQKPAFNLKESAREAFIHFSIPEYSFVDEVVPEKSFQLMRFLSWFQRQQIRVNINEIALPTILPGEDASLTPEQDWREFQFSFSGQLPPRYLFDGLDGTGIRIKSVRFELSNSSFNYTTEGIIYAKK
ncbi:type 4b pilus protein PilO2 [Pectobacterium atrosepticum]|uniref:type 4b pilus protein PilO2 n=1 Tax=Pectobacterium atrosepticum TaxID=29471 RepID=UPI00301AA4DB